MYHLLPFFILPWPWMRAASSVVHWMAMLRWWRVPGRFTILHRWQEEIAFGTMSLYWRCGFAIGRLRCGRFHVCIRAISSRRQLEIIIQLDAIFIAIKNLCSLPNYYSTLLYINNAHFLGILAFNQDE